jgi:amino acid permease
MGTQNVSLLLSFIGATAANILAYLGPAGFYLKLGPRGKLWNFAVFEVIFGLISMVVGLTGEIGVLAGG